MNATFPWRSTRSTRSSSRSSSRRSAARRRDERGLVFPSPVVILSVIAVAMAGVAFLATRTTAPTEREVTTASSTQTPGTTPTTAAPAPVAPTPVKKKKPPVNRSKIYVEVYNNSGIKGLAGGVAAKAGDAGWQVVGADNWYGTIPATTVYYPQRLERAASRLALDLGIKRKALAIDPMREDRLTVILTAPIG